MGAEESRAEFAKVKNSMNAINSIYAMFEQSNQVVLATLKQRNPRLSRYRIKNVEHILQQLLEPFKRNQKYNWGGQIYKKFKKHFMGNFEQLWIASRQQFYELLLTNCKINLGQFLSGRQKDLTYQDVFYGIASEQLQRRMVDTFMGDIPMEEIKRNAMKWSIVEEIQSNNVNYHDVTVTDQHVNLPDIKIKKVQATSLVIPETMFIHKMSAASQGEIFDLLKFYRRFTETLQQIVCSNNIISCPIKNFIVALEEKIGKKKIKMESAKKSELLGMGQESRKVRKIRQTNNNIILYEMRSFLEAYTEFVWMFLQLHLMEECSLGKIIQPEVLFTIIFKNLWTFFQWIADRGYEYEQAELEEYFLKNDGQIIQEGPNISRQNMEHLLTLLDDLRDEKHPQKYLKHLVVFYKEVSKSCENADDLLCLYEEVIREAAKQKGLRDLRLFKMRNIIDKLLRIEESSLNGGEITYSWTTWCILVELLKEKVDYKYGGLMITNKQSQKEIIKKKLSEYNHQDLGIKPGEKVRQSKKQMEIEIPQRRKE